MDHKLMQMKIELSSILADMMIQFRRMDGFSEDILLREAYKHIEKKLDDLMDVAFEAGKNKAAESAVPVTDLVSLNLPFQVKDNTN